MEAVPDDALAAILGRLPPCTLAASRCVCKAWRALVDARGLLLPHLLPHAVRGIFINYRWLSRLFAHPSSGFPRISGDLGFDDCGYRPFMDHCNGLLLRCVGGSRDQYCVMNPATRRWECFSSPREGRRDCAAYLVFDPAVSPHYEVFCVPELPEAYSVDPQNIPPRTFNLRGLFSSDDTLAMEDSEEEEEEQHILEELARPPPPPSMEAGFFPKRNLSLSAQWSMVEPDDPYGLMEWPPSPCTLHVFSSRTRRWEERSFVREGEPVGTMEYARLDSSLWMRPFSRYGVYWQGTLYVHCRGGFVMRLSLKLGKYQVLKTPVDPEDRDGARSFLGRSITGVCFATMYHNQLRIWNLNELSGRTEWVLKHQIDLDRSALRAAVRLSKRQTRGPWMLMDANIGEDSDSKVLPEAHSEWDSDDDCIVDCEEVETVEDEYYGRTFFVGFHPFKEVVFLMSSLVAVAYHLSTSKVQLLGKACPRGRSSRSETILEAFPYTPCMIGDLLYDYETCLEEEN